MTRIAAIFDLDDTILEGSSGRLFYRYLRETGLFTRYFRRRDALRAALAMAQWRAGLADVTYAMQRAARVATGIRVAPFWRTIQDWFDDMLVDLIREEAQEALERHRAQGHIPVICSAASQFSVLPVAAFLGINQVVYTEWLVVNGRLAGDIRLPVAYGPGKVHWMVRWAQQHDVDLSQSTFYSDHRSDAPLLAAVGHGVAVNPGRGLTRLANRHDWRVVHWGKKGRDR